MAVSNYFGDALLNHFFRATPMDVPDKVWVALHDNQGTVINEANEVKQSKWPSYVRLDANGGEDGVNGAFNPPSNKIITNSKQLLWPSFNGTGTIEIGGISLWTQQTGGQMLFGMGLSSKKTLSPSDEIVIHIGSLSVKVS